MPARLGAGGQSVKGIVGEADEAGEGAEDDEGWRVEDGESKSR